MRNWKQFSLTLMTAGLIPPVFLIIAITVEDAIQHVSVDVPFVTFAYAILCAAGLILALFIVFPAFAFLDRRGWLNSWTAIGAGALEGLAPISALVFLKVLIDGQPGIELTLALWLEAAAISGAVLGGWVWRRLTPKPDLKTDIF